MEQPNKHKNNQNQEHKIKLPTLMLAGIGTIIGSGWLFGSAHVAKMAGPAGIFSWVIGAVMILVIALNLIELSTIAPIRMGSMGYFLRYTHGSFAGFIAEWTILIGFISSIPSEATASTQYLSEWNYVWAHSLFNHNTNSLTLSGLIISSLLCFIYFFINYYSLRFLARSIKTLTIFKLFVPTLAVFMFLYAGFHVDNLHIVGNHSLAPYGISGIFTAVATSGVIYAFNGFQAPITFAAETHNPKRNIPLALIGSVFISAVIYISLQFVYLVSMPTDLLIKYGWNGLNLSSPFASLAISLNLNLLAILLFIDAFISPSGGGIIYTSLSGRVFFGMGDYLPKWFGNLDVKSRLPKNALLAVLVISILSLWLLPSWEKLAAVISVGYILCYATVPVSVYSFRKLSPVLPHKDAIRVYGVKILAPIGFIFATFMLYWSRSPLNAEVILIVLLGLPIYIFYAKKRQEAIMPQLSKCIWMIAYLVFVAIYGFFGSKNFGGTGLIPDVYIIDHILLACLSMIFFIWGVSVSFKTNAYIEEIDNRQT